MNNAAEAATVAIARCDRYEQHAGECEETVAVSGIAALVGLVFLAIGVSMVLAQWRFRKRSVLTRGEILALNARRPRSDSGTSMLYYPVVRFMTATGQQVEAQARVGTNPAPGRVGQAVSIRYDPSTPERFAVGTSSVLLTIFASLFAIIGVIVLFYAIPAFIGSLHR